MSEHTPLTEAEEDLVEFVRTFETGESAANALPLLLPSLRVIAARTSTATADAGLRERVEALADEWEGWAKNRSTPRIDAFRHAAEYLRDALDATPASTEDRADNEGTP